MSLPATTKPLNPKQLKFAQLYVASGNATQAYIDAGYSAVNAAANASTLRTNQKVAEEIVRLKTEYAKAAGIDKIWVLERYKAHVDAELLHPKQWPKHMRRLVESVKVVQKRTGTVILNAAGTPQLVPMYTKEVKLEGRIPALKHLLDFVAGIPDTVTNVTNNVQINVDKLLLSLDAPVPA